MRSLVCSNWTAHLEKPKDGNHKGAGVFYGTLNAAIHRAMGGVGDVLHRAMQ